MASPVDMWFYREAYGGELDAEAFAAAAPAAARLMRRLTRYGEPSADWPAADAACWNMAFCAAADAFAEFGEGRIGGVEVGSFKVTNYMEKGTTGLEVAMDAALAELAGTGLAFCGAA